MDYVSDSTFFAVEVNDVIITFARLKESEMGNIVDARWVAPADLASSMSLSSLDLHTIAQAAVALCATLRKIQPTRRGSVVRLS